MDALHHFFKSLILLIALSAISHICVAQGATQDFNKLALELVSNNKVIWNKAHKKLNNIDQRSKLLLMNSLLKAISSQEDIQSRKAGVIVLGEISLDLPLETLTRRVIPFLSKIHILEGKREDSDAAELALIKIGKPAIPFLMSLLRHTGSAMHLFERVKVLHLLDIHIRNNNKEIIAELINYIDDDMELGREGVILALRNLKPSNVKYIPKLIKVFNEPRNKMLRSHIAIIFLNMGKVAVEAGPSLIDGLRAKDDEYLRRISANALGKLGKLYTNSIPALINALNDPSCDVRTNAMVSLNEIGEQKGLSAVKRYEASKKYCNHRDIK